MKFCSFSRSKARCLQWDILASVLSTIIHVQLTSSSLIDIHVVRYQNAPDSRSLLAQFARMIHLRFVTCAAATMQCKLIHLARSPAYIRAVSNTVSTRPWPGRHPLQANCGSFHSSPAGLHLGFLRRPPTGELWTDSTPLHFSAQKP